MPSVHYFTEDIRFSLKNKTKISKWISSTISTEKKKLKEINLIFCSDAYLFAINHKYLNHDSFTDIITFDNSDKVGEIEGDIFISVDRITENKERFMESFEKELLRVIIHGVLHLIGYKDKDREDTKIMREKEDHYLESFNHINVPRGTST